MFEEIKGKAEELINKDGIKEVVGKAKEFIESEKGEELINTAKEKLEDIVSDKTDGNQIVQAIAL